MSDFKREGLATTVGKPLTLIFDEMASAGYQWTPKESAGLEVSRVPVRTCGNEPGSIGGPVKARFDVKASETGVYDLDFEYKRPWEQTDASVETKHYKITVK